MTTGYVLFRLGESEYAAPLDDVREIVRLDGLETVPGAQPPLAGLVVLRGAPLPVFDVRPAPRPSCEVDGRGDVLVMTLDGDTVGVAVDRVVAVLPPEALPAADAPPRALPAYVVGVRRHEGDPVLLVDLRRLLDVAAAAVGPADPVATVAAG